MLSSDTVISRGFRSKRQVMQLIFTKDVFLLAVLMKVLIWNTNDQR